MLHGVSMDFPQGAFTAIVGESGCGKSTVASVLTGRCRGYTGSAALSGGEISALSADSLLRTVTYVGFSSYLFRGTVAENLRMARPDADDASLWDVLERVRLAGFLRGERGLDTPLDAQGANLSGGQRQRLALARALLHDSPVYVFDEATSNIDVESENDIMAEIRALARRRTVIVITHRLANVTDADSIYVLEAGTVAGTRSTRRTAGPGRPLQNALGQTAGAGTLWDRGGERMKQQRSGFSVMRRLIVLVRPLAPFMALAVLLGVAGFVCAIFLTILGGWAILEVLGLGAPWRWAACSPARRLSPCCAAFCATANRPATISSPSSCWHSSAIRCSLPCAACAPPNWRAGTRGI